MSNLRGCCKTLLRAGVVCICLACTACSTLSLEAAQTLAATGGDAAVKIKAAAFASGDEYAGAMDAEALYHGMTGTTASPAYTELKVKYAKVHVELAKRQDVVKALADFYVAFGNLASYDASGQTQDALKNLGTAVDGYRKDVLNLGPVSPGTVDLIVHIGGLFASEVQKAMVKDASASVRPKLVAFHDALADKLVRTQFTGFKELLAADRAAAVVLLWQHNVLDASPLVADLAAEGGLIPTKDAGRVVLHDEQLKAGLQAVITRRMDRKLDAIGQGYDASVRIVADLIEEHRKLEDGGPLDIARIRALVAELTAIVNLINKR